MNCEHKIVRTIKVKEYLYMEKKGQLTAETVEGMFNNALMWEGRSLVRFRHTCISVTTNRSTCVHTNKPSLASGTQTCNTCFDCH